MLPSKTCRICKFTMSIGEFHPNKSCKDGVIGTCRTCTNERVRKWREGRPNKKNPYKNVREYQRAWANERNRSRKKEMIEQFGSKCFDCGQSFQDCVYDFHHLYGKDMNPSAAIALSKERRDKELAKCVMLCSNCHRIRHHGAV